VESIRSVLTQRLCSVAPTIADWCHGVRELTTATFVRPMSRSRPCSARFAHRPYAKTLVSALPVLAVDGSLSFVTDFTADHTLAGAVGQVSAKTGTFVDASEIVAVAAQRGPVLTRALPPPMWPPRPSSALSSLPSLSALPGCGL